MPKFVKIDVDEELHRFLETNRMSARDSHNDVLRRLLRMPAAEGEAQATADGDWASHGVSLPNGTQLRITYNGQTDYGEIRDGAWWIYNTRYDSPSGAAGAVARSRRGGFAKVDGWRYWQVRRPGDGRWVPLGELRPDTA